MKKVLCVNPPPGEKIGKLSRDGRCQSEEGTWSVTFPPATLASVAGHIRSRGHQVKLIDCIGSNLGWNKLRSEVVSFQPDVTIINTVTPTIRSDLYVSRIVKEIDPLCLTAAYGTMPSSLPFEVKRMEPSLDFCIMGDAEAPALEIVEKGELFDGFWIEEDLDKLGMPAYELLPNYYFPLTQERWMFVIDGKGCPYNCIYCVEPKMSGRKARYKSLERVIQEVKFVVENMNVPLFMFWDELFTLNRDRTLKLCELLILEGLHKKCRWMITTRADRADLELFKAMRGAGCWMIAFGIESANQEVLDRVRKEITVEQCRAAVEAAKRAGLKTVAHFIIGLPGSSIETERQTINFAKRLGLDFAQFYTCTAFPGAELYELALKNKWLSVSDWEGIEQGTANISYPDFPAKEIQRLRRKAYREFYLRPKFFFNYVRCISLKALICMIPRVWKFIRWARK